MKSVSSCAILLLVSVTGMPLAQTKGPATSFECRRAEGRITIDGKADEPAWQKAQLIDYFYQPWLGAKARPAKTATKARLLWDDDNFYFFADMEDHDLYADVTEHDGMCWNNDVFELFFKPADDKPAYYEFQVNAAGTMLDMLIPERGKGGYPKFKSADKFHFENKVILRGTLNQRKDKDEGWSVEGKIPWKDFARTGGRPKAGAMWKLNLSRYDYDVRFDGPELSTCAPLTQRDYHRWEDYATVKFVK